MASILFQGLLYTLCLFIMPAHLFECPDSIYPCFCYENYGGTAMVCKGIWSGEELKDIIHDSDFGNDYKFKRFSMSDSALVRVIENGTFQQLEIDQLELNDDHYGKTNNIEIIERGAFHGKGENSLEKIYAQYMNLKIFPFEDLDSLNKLDLIDLRSNNIIFVGDLTSSSLIEIYLQNNSISEIPAISMYKLETLNISLNALTGLPNNVFSNVPDLITLDMSHNPLTSLPPNAFHNLTSVGEMFFNNGFLTEVLPDMWSNNTGLRDVSLKNNYISVLPTGFFTPSSKNDINLDLSNNTIESVQPGAFEAIRGMHIYLEDNNLAVLEEETWRYLLQNRVLLHLEGNPFTCGCDVAWIVRDHYLFDSMGDEPTCTSGEKIVELNAEDFEEC